MAWQMTSQMIEFCSCKLLCPCFVGPDGVPDQGWCAGALVFDIDKGEVDGVKVDGCCAALGAHWPGNFFAGNGTARLYLNERCDEQQREALEAVFTGRKGGLFEGLMGAVVARWLPSKTVPIDITRGNSLSIRIGDIAEASVRPLTGAEGKPISVEGLPAQQAFQSTSMDLASSKGTRWSDPDMQAWEGDSGSIHRVRWSG